MLIRWTIYQPYFWEISYSLPGWFGMGMTLSSQFVALSASRPERNAATSVTTYYLVQQIGFMSGITLAKSLLMNEMRRRLSIALGDGSESAEVRPMFSVPYAQENWYWYYDSWSKKYWVIGNRWNYWIPCFRTLYELSCNGVITYRQVSILIHLYKVINCILTELLLKRLQLYLC